MECELDCESVVKRNEMDCELSVKRYEVECELMWNEIKCMKSSVNGYEWVWKDMKWISVRDSHWISQCEPNSSMQRFSKLRHRGTQLADLIRITRKVFKFSKCCCTPKANALAGSAAVRQLPSVRKLLIALECLENGRQTWSHSSACEENKKTGLIIIFRKSKNN